VKYSEAAAVKVLASTFSAVVSPFDKFVSVMVPVGLVALALAKVASDFHATVNA